MQTARLEFLEAKFICAKPFKSRQEIRFQLTARKLILMSKTKTLSFNIPSDIMNKLVEIITEKAKEKNISRSQVFSELLEKMLDEGVLNDFI